MEESSSRVVSDQAERIPPDAQGWFKNVVVCGGWEKGKRFKMRNSG